MDDETCDAYSRASIDSVWGEHAALGSIPGADGISAQAALWDREEWERTIKYGTNAPPPSPNAAANFELGMRQMAAYQERTRTRARRRPWYWGRTSRGR